MTTESTYVNSRLKAMLSRCIKYFYSSFKLFINSVFHQGRKIGLLAPFLGCISATGVLAFSIEEID